MKPFPHRTSSIAVVLLLAACSADPTGPSNPSLPPTELVHPGEEGEGHNVAPATVAATALFARQRRSGDLIVCPDGTTSESGCPAPPVQPVPAGIGF